MAYAGLWLAALIASLLSWPARADYPDGLADRSPAQLAADAFAAEYGALILDDIVRTLEKSAAPGCLKTAGLDTARLRERAREIFVRHATRIFTIHMALIDKEKFEAAFTALAGTDAIAEVIALRQHPDVRTYQALIEPARLAGVVDEATDTIDRFLLLSGNRLAKRFSPIGSGDATLLDANPTDRSREAALSFAETQDSPALDRWRELLAAIRDAHRQSIDKDYSLKLGPRQFVGGVENDLAGVCVKLRSR